MILVKFTFNSKNNYIPKCRDTLKTKNIRLPYIQIVFTNIHEHNFHVFEITSSCNYDKY